VAALRSTLATVLAPLVERYQAGVVRLQSAMTWDLAAANRSLHWTRLSLTTLMHLEQLQGWVIAPSMVALHRAPTGSSAVAGWVAPGARLPLVGYVWGWTVRNPRTGVRDVRWYVVYPLPDERGYLYVPAALLRVSALSSAA